jgi:hypothetical protein
MGPGFGLDSSGSGLLRARSWIFKFDKRRKFPCTVERQSVSEVSLYPTHLAKLANLLIFVINALLCALLVRYNDLKREVLVDIGNVFLANFMELSWIQARRKYLHISTWLRFYRNAILIRPGRCLASIDRRRSAGTVHDIKHIKYSDVFSHGQWINLLKYFGKKCIISNWMSITYIFFFHKFFHCNYLLRTHHSWCSLIFYSIAPRNPDHTSNSRNSLS